MDDFGGWSMPYAAEPCLPSRPSDDGLLLSEFLGGGFDLRSDHGGLDLPSSYPAQNLVQCHGGAGLSAGAPAGFMGLDTADVLPRVGAGAGAVEDGLLDPFVYAPNVVVGAVAEEPAQAAASNTAFSGYSSTTGGNGNFSSGESNSCGGGGGYDTEVASPPCCAVSRPGLLQTTTGGAPPSKRKPGKYATAMSASGTKAAAAAAGRRGEKQAAATSSSSTSIAFKGSADGGGGYEPDSEAIAQVKEMIYRAAAMRPVHQLVCGAGEPPASQSQTCRPRRKNVRISSDPQTVAARLRRERVSERLRVLQRLVPGGSRMDTASMLDEAASYLKFLKSQLKALERASPSNGGYHSSSLLQSYAGSSSLGVGGGSGGASTVLAFGRDSAMGGYVKSNRDMQL